MGCLICSRSSTSRFCERHRRALSLVEERYEDWKTAQDITWKDYLVQILNNANTGLWAKEVVKNLIEEGEARDQIWTQV